MDSRLFDIILLCVSILAVAIKIIYPYVKSQVGVDRMDEFEYWVQKAVQAAEVLFDVPGSGEQKREYVINFINNMFNSKKEVITKEQIHILLESAWKEMTEE